MTKKTATAAPTRSSVPPYDELAASARGRLILPEDAGYDDARLAAVKKRYDPGNLFHVNQNIPPEDFHELSPGT